MTVLHAALDLADKGIPVFPVLASKAPACERGFQDASIDPSEIRKLWRLSSAPLIGIPTGQASGFTVVDVDPRNGGDGWLAAVNLPPTRRHVTRSGGVHLLFDYEPGIRNSASRVAPGVDVRGDGGFIVWWPAAGCGVVDAPAARMPEWLAVACRPKPAPATDITRAVAQPSNASAVRALTDACRAIRAAAPGSRYDACREATWSLARLVRGGFLDEQAAREAVHDAAEDAGGENLGLVDALWTGALAKVEPAAVPGVEFAAAPAPIVEPGVALLEITEEHASTEFARRYERQFVFDHTDKQWFRFAADVGWQPDESGSVTYTARQFVAKARERWGYAKSEKAGSIGFSRAVVTGGESDPRMAVTRDRWDADPYVLGIPGGHVDLRTGTVHAADAGRFVRRRAAVAPADGAATVWRRFLDDATGGDAELQAWLQRLVGYALTGDMREEMLAFVYGPGGNGKGVFLHTVSRILGDYAYQAPAELFREDSRINREYQLARLPGIRLILASETEDRYRMAESLVKEITGNEGPLNARNPYGRPFTFRSQAKLLLVSNHAPKLTGRSDAMERRFRVVPFNRKPASPDRTLKERLVAEYPQILRWMIDGCLAWQRVGLGVCSAVTGASTAYFEEQDTLALWLKDRCTVGSGRTAANAALSDYNDFRRDRGEKHVDARVFKESMLGFGAFEWKRITAGNVVTGLTLHDVGLD